MGDDRRCGTCESYEPWRASEAVGECVRCPADTEFVPAALEACRHWAPQGDAPEATPLRDFAVEMPQPGVTVTNTAKPCAIDNLTSTLDAFGLDANSLGEHHGPVVGGALRDYPGCLRRNTQPTEP